MVRAKNNIFLFILMAIFFLSPFSLYGEGPGGGKSDLIATGAADSGAEKKSDYPSMPSPGKKVLIGNDYYIIYGFDKKPKLGTIIMKVEIYTKDGKKDTSLEVMADSGMPSMKGAHETGDQRFTLSKKGAYLLPINIVMPGDWEIRLTIKKDGKVIFRGSHQFDV